MKLFVPGADALAMSMALYELHRPLSIRDPQDGTTALFSTVEAADKSLWLVVDTELTIRVHPLASFEAVAAFLQSYEDSGALPAGTLEELSAYVEANRGQKLVVYEAFPALFKLADTDNPTGLGRTFEQMIQEKRLPNPTLP